MLNIAPPEEAETGFAVGIGSLTALFVLLLISSLVQTQTIKRLRKLWIVISSGCFIITIISVLFYMSNTNKLTFGYPPENPKTRHIAGTRMTPIAEEYSKKYSSPLSSAELVAAFEGPQFIERVWTKESVEKSKMILTINYFIVILGTATMIFSLTEGILAVKKEKYSTNSDTQPTNQINTY